MNLEGNDSGCKRWVVGRQVVSASIADLIPSFFSCGVFSLHLLVFVEIEVEKIAHVRTSACSDCNRRKCSMQYFTAYLYKIKLVKEKYKKIL